MQAIKKSQQIVRTVPFGVRAMSVDMKEIDRLHAKLMRKINVLKMFTDHKKFNYEQPRMTYDKETGDVHIHDPNENVKKKKIINNVDEIFQEKKALFEEVGLDEDGMPIGINPEDADPSDIAERMKKVQSAMEQEYDFDPSQLYVFSTDFMRVDVGLLIQRPPIFVRMRDQDFNFMKQRQNLMEEYYCDTKQFIEEFNEVSKLNEDILAKNPYCSRMNIDNYPTHKSTDPVTGEETTYCAASKQWSLVDPECKDQKSLHYAGEDRIYLLVKNRYTGEWEFPVTKMYFGETFFKAKFNLFQKLTGNQWRIKFFGSSPYLHTLREFTPIEKQDKLNIDMKGVRTYWFGAHHWRGIPEMIISETEDNKDSEYCDWEWVPKRQLNEYFTKDYYNVFINICKTR